MFCDGEGAARLNQAGLRTNLPEPQRKARHVRPSIMEFCYFCQNRVPIQKHVFVVNE
ncbi:unnamed protein product [Ectocarpus sp. CCAP 1310/34]|nr:unnamed protein product [Ectocarpus sp. CCAP 1310/34]